LRANPYNYGLLDPHVGSASLNWFQTAKDKKVQKASPNIFVVIKYPGYRFFCNLAHPASKFVANSWQIFLLTGYTIGKDTNIPLGGDN
jgi:hypothetical protein